MRAGLGRTRCGFFEVANDTIFGDPTIQLLNIFKNRNMFIVCIMIEGGKKGANLAVKILYSQSDIIVYYLIFF